MSQPPPPPGGPPPQPPAGWSPQQPPPGWQAQPPGPGVPWQPPPPPSSDGRVGVIVLSAVLALCLLAVAGVGLLLLTRVPTVGDLEVGQCLRSGDLAQGEDQISSFSVVACSESHDAEVVGVVALSEADAGAFSTRGPELCAANSGDVAARSDAGVETRPFTAAEQPDSGDPLVCLARRTDGGKLTAPVA